MTLLEMEIRGTVLDFDVYEYMGAVPPPRFRHVKPLSEFPEDHRLGIAFDVLQPRRPEQWLGLGDTGRGRPLAMIESRAWYEWLWHRAQFSAETRAPLSKKQRLRIIERDGYICGLCRGVVDPELLHIDHIIPVARGGKNEDSNLQVAHAFCNMSKGARV